MPHSPGNVALELGPRLLDYALRVAGMESPDEILEECHKITRSCLRLSMLGAIRFPVKVTDWKSIQLGKTAFLHRDVPRGWWDEYWAIAQRRDAIGYMMARISIAPHTWTETLQWLRPVGVDRWSFDLALKYGMR
jgi:hypothetical protein